MLYLSINNGNDNHCFLIVTLIFEDSHTFKKLLVNEDTIN